MNLDTAEKLTRDINLINKESRNLTPYQIERLVRAAFKKAKRQARNIRKEKEQKPLHG